MSATVLVNSLLLPALEARSWRRLGASSDIVGPRGGAGLGGWGVGLRFDVRVAGAGGGCGRLETSEV